ncbi:MAG: ATP-binding protein [Candidatus Aminicenantes bacterium]|nr:ATP-binding protein [Candidatus Aminicenantes bacterium]
MLGKEFRGLAETVTRTYGNNPWFFLRELAQNSRDAGARNIRVEALATQPGMETLIFADDGHGMTLGYARRFLFRLYASDKTADHKAAGKYGIGFWTILGFQPTLIHLQSRRGKNSWAVELDSELNVRPAVCLLTRSGTTVSMSRPAVFPLAAEFKSRLEVELREYCQYLRRNNRQADMLPVWFAGKNLTRPMALPEPFSCRFRSGSVEGAVGLAAKPHVRLYARGLPVWQGALLKQMTHLQMNEDGCAEIGRNLAPVFLLNGNRLDVTFSRNLALENSALENVRKKAEKALRRLLELSLERTFPRTRLQRICDRSLAALKRILRPGWHWLPLFLLLIVPLEIAILRHWFPAVTAVRTSPFSLQSTTLSYGGATVSLSVSPQGPPFFYQPNIPAWFRLFAADAYDIQAGCVRRAEPSHLPAHHTQYCRPDQVWSMRLQAETGGEIFLPMPPGHALQAGSVHLDGRRINSIFSSVQGEAIAAIPGNGGLVEYRSCPAGQRRELTAADILHLTLLPPELSLPPALEKSMQESRAYPIAERVSLARMLVGNMVTYDTSVPTSNQYLRLAGGRPWLEKVLSIAKGDCDIINGLNVLLLRKMGIPSRLVIGMIGEQGRARPLLHAWSEYFDQGWLVTDASAGRPADHSVTAAYPNPGRGINLTLPVDDARTEDTRVLNSLLGPTLILLVMAAAAGLLFVIRNKNGAEASLPPDTQMRNQLIQLVQQAMLQPEIWGRDNPLWSHRILPTANGKSLSVRQALRLLDRKKLFITANRNPLAMAMAVSGIAVLDLSQPLYAPLRTLLSAAIDTDMLCQLRPLPPLPAPGLEYALLGAVNDILNKALHMPVLCLIAPGLNSTDLLKIALPVPLHHGPFFFPQRFVAVNPAGATFRHWSSLFKRNQPLAVFKFLSRLHADRLLDAEVNPALLKKAARSLLRTCS